MLAATQVHSPDNPDAPLNPQRGAVDAALSAWRGKAADILITATAVVHLPAVVIVALGYGPALGLAARAVAYTAYLLMAGSALLRRVPQRTRLFTVFFAYYLVTVAANLAALRGPYAQVGLVVYPVLVLVLLGAPAARVAVLASAAVLVSSPFLRGLPIVIRMMGTPPGRLADPPDVAWMQAAGLTAFLTAMMIVLDRFHHFLLDALGAQCRAMAERHRLEREVAAIGDRERRRLGQDLHDGVSQQLAGALLRCAALEDRLSREQSHGTEDARALTTLLESALEESQEVARGLCPVDMHPEALGPALRALSCRAGATFRLRCEYRAEGDASLRNSESTLHLYRIAQEAVNNAGKHSGASQVTITLAGSEDAVVLKVEDNGTGLPASASGGFGLRIMDYRASLIGATLTFERPAPGGTRVVCRVPRGASVEH